MPPYRFIPYFEKDATIDKIDDLVLKKICETMSRWKREGKPLYPVSVNLSRMRMNDENLIDKLTDMVDSYGVDHNLIDFELTESASYDNMERMLLVLRKLRERGFKISMDDFGTGYSSLSLLTQMPIDQLRDLGCEIIQGYYYSKPIPIAEYEEKYL
ncbi:EAL domain-containing protein [Agathobacter sp.]|uniref:EAL domain-containing protein n=1 Tax=Agathobacter sp. TaxID=2021311 RepID=UPI00258B8D24|nr:EAL domain-containing protein [Agathobacter sp.]